MREASQQRVDDLDSSEIPNVDLAALRPFKSATVLQFDEDEVGLAIRAIRRFVRGIPAGKDAQYTIVGTGWDSSDSATFAEISEFDDIDLIVYRNDTPPSWARKDSIFVDNEHLLNIALFRRGLVVIHLAEPWKSAIQRWLDGSPRPPLQRVPPAVLEHSFLRGAAKGLWLKRTNSRRASTPDAKNYTGGDLGSSLDPIGDAPYSMGSARAEYLNDLNPGLRGTIGTTPRKSTVWCGSSGTFSEFVEFCGGLIEEIEQTTATGNFGESIFPELAEEIASLDGVFGAFEVVFDWPDMPLDGILEIEALERVSLLDQVQIEISGRSDSANFDAHIKFPEDDANILGEIEVRSNNSGFDLSCVINRPGRNRTTGILRDCFTDTDLASVYFESGHTITNGRLYKFEVKSAKFKNWVFEDFSNFDVYREKPDFPTELDMFAAIGSEGDRSLFSWVARNHRSGYLTCDDGSGEVSDFIYIAEDLSSYKLIHVKGAQGNGGARGVSAQAYEVVASQAAKNLVYLNHDVLRQRLSRPECRLRPSWSGGIRMPDRSKFVEALENLRPTATAEVYVIQPHMRQGIYRTFDGDQGQSSEVMRLRLLETLLNNVRSSAIAYGSDLYVVGDGSGT